MMTPALSVHCQTLEEAGAALAAIAACRNSDPVSAPKADLPLDQTATLADRIENALEKSRPNQARRILLEILLETPVGIWRPFSDMESAFESARLAAKQAQAGLGYFSWQMGAYMPADDLLGMTKNIEVMVERSRTDGAHKYRLTPAGRIAVGQFLGREPEAT
jgi:hypothetical protein